MLLAVCYDVSRSRYCSSVEYIMRIFLAADLGRSDHISSAAPKSLSRARLPKINSRRIKHFSQQVCRVFALSCNLSRPNCLRELNLINISSLCVCAFITSAKEVMFYLRGVCLSVCPSVRPSVRLSVCLSVCLSVNKCT